MFSHYEVLSLPENWQLEPLFDDTQAELQTLLNQRYVLNDYKFGDILTVYENSKATELITKLCATVIEESPSEAINSVCLEGFYLAHTATQILLPHAPVLAVKPVFNEISNNTGIITADNLRAGTFDYSMRNPTIGGFIVTHLFEITDDEALHDLAEQFALLTFMFIDAGQRKLYLERTITDSIKN